MSNEDIVVRTREIEEKVRRLLSQSGSNAFKPFVVFDEGLDCIRVVARDCSVTEMRINEVLTVLSDNYPDADEQTYVGFTIKGAKHFCKRHSLPISGAVKISEILDRILAQFPEPAVALTVNAVARQILKDNPDVQTVELNPTPVASH